MSTYDPAFETQRDEWAPLPWTNCNPASVSMLIDLWTYGQIDTSDVELRRASPIPLDQGMNFRAVADAVRKLFPQLGAMLYSERDGSGNRQMTWAKLRDHLSSGGGAVAAGSYSSLVGFKSTTGLAVNRWQPGGTFGHALFVYDYNPADVTVAWMDPLGHGDYQGERVALDCLWAFIWRNANGPEAVVTAAHSFNSPRPAPRRFRDVDPRAFYADAIERLVAAGLITGYDDGTMRPLQPLTRGEAFTLIDRVLQES